MWHGLEGVARGAMTSEQAVFATFGLASQALLVAFFAARRSWRRADVLGKASYGFAALGLPLAILLVVDGQSSTLFIGPLLIATWAVFGTIVDIWRPRPWRGPPIQWSVLGPYLAIYFAAQMFMWWPLWKFAREAWVVFTILFAVNTALNIQGHRRPGPSGT